MNESISQSAALLIAISQHSASHYSVINYYHDKNLIVEEIILKFMRILIPVAPVDRGNDRKENTARTENDCHNTMSTPFFSLLTSTVRYYNRCVSW